MPDSHHGFIPTSAEDVLRRRVKQELRKRMRGLRKTLPAAACKERAARIVERLAALEPIATARSVALFWPIEAKHEVDLRALDGALRARGARVAYPALTDEGRTMIFRFASDSGAMVETAMGLREPAETEPLAGPGDIDAIVVPALALDLRGHRVGYGGGYYDRALAVHAPRAFTVSVGYDFQLMSEIPNTEGDFAVAWVVTDARSEKTSPAAAAAAQT